MEEVRHYETKTLYLDNVSGQEIIIEQDKINAGDNQFTVGSIINSVFGSNGATTGKFYAWLTYKIAPSALKGVTKPEVKVDIGEVPVTMTDKEGRAMDDGYSRMDLLIEAEKKEEMKVVI